MYITLKEAEYLVDAMKNFNLQSVRVESGEPNGICTENFAYFDTKLNDYNVTVKLCLTDENDW